MFHLRKIRGLAIVSFVSINIEIRGRPPVLQLTRHDSCCQNCSSFYRQSRGSPNYCDSFSAVCPLLLPFASRPRTCRNSHVLSDTKRAASGDGPCVPDFPDAAPSTVSAPCDKWCCNWWKGKLDTNQLAGRHYGSTENKWTYLIACGLNHTRSVPKCKILLKLIVQRS